MPVPPLRAVTPELEALTLPFGLDLRPQARRVRAVLAVGAVLAVLAVGAILARLALRAARAPQFLACVLLSALSEIEPGLICLDEVIVYPDAATEVPIVAMTSAADATTSAAEGLRMIRPPGGSLRAPPLAHGTSPHNSKRMPPSAEDRDVERRRGGRAHRGFARRRRRAPWSSSGNPGARSVPAL